MYSSVLSSSIRNIGPLIDFTDVLNDNNQKWGRARLSIGIHTSIKQSIEMRISNKAKNPNPVDSYIIIFNCHGSGGLYLDPFLL